MPASAILRFNLRTNSWPALPVSVGAVAKTVPFPSPVSVVAVAKTVPSPSPVSVSAVAELATREAAERTAADLATRQAAVAKIQVGDVVAAVESQEGF